MERRTHLVERLERLRQSISIPGELPPQAYEVISDHIARGVPGWDGLTISTSGIKIIRETKYKSMARSIEALRADQEIGGYTHYLMAEESPRDTPFLLRVKGNSKDASVEEWDWLRGSWGAITHEISTNKLVKLHQKCLWPVFLSQEQGLAYVSYVLAYKMTHDRVLGIWALHAIADHAIESMFGSENLAKLLYPPFCCLNSAVGEKLDECDRPRMDLALLAEETLTGRSLKPKALHKAIAQHPKHVGHFAKDILDAEEPFRKLSDDRSMNYRMLFTALVKEAAELADIPEQETWPVEMEVISAIFVGWHLRQRRTTSAIDNDNGEWCLLQACEHLGKWNPRKDYSGIKEAWKNNDAEALPKRVALAFFGDLEGAKQSGEVVRLGFRVFMQSLGLRNGTDGFGSVEDANTLIARIMQLG